MYLCNYWHIHMYMYMKFLYHNLVIMYAGMTVIIRVLLFVYILQAPDYVCPKCESRHTTVEKLRQHCLTNHPIPESECEPITNKDGLYECKSCDYTWKSKTSFYNHLQKFHGRVQPRQRKTNEGRFTCEVCHKSYTRARYLRVHMKTHYA